MLALMVCLIVFFFFFSSRRRHTRLVSDWSSDVCSSDLLSQGPRARITHEYAVPLPRPRDPVRARMHPAFAPLYDQLWNDLSEAVGARPKAAEAAEAAE